MDAFINNHPVITGIICVIIIIAATLYILVLYRWAGISGGKDGISNHLTPTQKFILAASSPTICNNYKCVIDIWDTHKSENEIRKVKQLFEWGWGEFTYENAKMAWLNCNGNDIFGKFQFSLDKFHYFFYSINNFIFK